MSQDRSARRTANAAILSRKLLDAVGGVVVVMHDCGTDCGVPKRARNEGEAGGQPLRDTIRGRVSMGAITTEGAEEILGKDHVITREVAERIEALHIRSVLVRSPTTCLARTGVCRLCYGGDPRTGELVPEGTKVGVLATRALGEAAGRLPRGKPNAPDLESILAEEAGCVSFEGIEEGVTLRKEYDASTGQERWVVAGHSSGLHPRVRIEDAEGSLCVYDIPAQACLEVRPGQLVTPGALLATFPREESGRIGAGFGAARLRNLLEARSPSDPAVLADVAGRVIVDGWRRGKRVVLVHPLDEAGNMIDWSCEHRVPADRRLNVRTGDLVREGEPLVPGPVCPHNVLRIAGPEVLQERLVAEVQALCQAEHVEIDDRHIELVLARMLRAVRVVEPGDSGLKRGALLDRFAFREVNERLHECVRIEAPGASGWRPGQVLPRDEFLSEQGRLKQAGQEVPTGESAANATAALHLMGITEAARLLNAARPPAEPSGSVPPG
jgi:DNA-directed RNA polymerase subunit beta'